MVHPPLFLLLVLFRGLEQGQELAEPHDVHQFVGDDIEQQGTGSGKSMLRS
jgi:hypothetical protein